MPNLVEGKYPGEFLASEGNGSIARDTVTLSGGVKIVAGTILGILTANGKAVPVVLGAADGSQTASLICFGNVDTTAADVVGAVVAREAEVNGRELTYPAGASANQIAAINTALAAKNIIVRTGI